jgi:5-methylcytosine-specific restriction endonuclease McrA
VAITRKTRRLLMAQARMGRGCAGCGSKEDLTLDHIVPRSKGGPDGKANLRVLCRPCNEAKANRLPERPPPVKRQDWWARPERLSRA